jgi:hypothetical protein
MKESKGLRALRPDRATSRKLSDTLWLVEFRGSDYTVTKIHGIWRIKGRYGFTHDIPDNDFGKESAIEWIELNC